MDIKDISRRSLLKILPALPTLAIHPTLSVNGKMQAGIVAPTPRFFMLFADAGAIDFEALGEAPVPDGIEIAVIPVNLRNGQKLEDAVKMYEVKGPDE